MAPVLQHLAPPSTVEDRGQKRLRETPLLLLGLVALHACTGSNASAPSCSLSSRNLPRPNGRDSRYPCELSVQQETRLLLQAGTLSFFEMAAPPSSVVTSGEPRRAWP